MRQFLQLYVMSVNRDVHSLSLFLTNGFGSSRMNLKTDECFGNALNLNLFECQIIHTFSQMCNEIKIKIRITQKFIFNFQFLAEIGKRKNWQSKKDFILYISFHFKSLLKSGFYKNILLSWLMGKVRAIYKST